MPTLTKEMLDDYIKDFLDAAMVADDGSRKYKEARLSATELLNDYSDLLLDRKSERDIELNTFRLINSTALVTLIKLGIKHKNYVKLELFEMILAKFITYIGDEIFKLNEKPEGLVS